MSDDRVITIFPSTPAEKTRAPSRMPVLKTVFYTLRLSVHFLWLALWRRFTLDKSDGMLHTYARRIFTAGRAGLTVTGREHFEPGRPYVVMTNHRSQLDIPAMFASTPGHLRMVLKQELLRVPIWGQALKGSGFIPVDRKNTKKAIEQLEFAKKRLAEGISVWIAPEGTRSKDGKLHAFKKGGFHLAHQFGVPILPAWIEGTDAILPPGQLHVRFGGTASVTFGPPISTAGLDIPELMNRVRTAILELAPRADGPPVDAAD